MRLGGVGEADEGIVGHLACDTDPRERLGPAGNGR
jgi:hypothetical protein